MKNKGELLDLFWKDVYIYVLYYGDSDKMVDEDKYHMSSRKHPEQGTGE